MRVVIDLFGWVWTESVNTDIESTDLLLSSSDPPANWLLFPPRQMSNWLTSRAPYVWMTFRALQTGSTTKDQQQSLTSTMNLKYLNWKLTREAEAFQTAAAWCRSSTSFMSAVVKYWATKTLTFMIKTKTTFGPRSVRARALASSCCVRNPRQARKRPTVPAGGPWNIPTLVVRSLCPAYLKLNLQNHNLWGQPSNVVTFRRRTRHQCGSVIQSTPSHLRWWTCVATGGVMLPAVLSGWGPVPNTSVTFGTTKGEILPPFLSVATGKLIAAWTCCLTSLTLTVGAELTSTNIQIVQFCLFMWASAFKEKGPNPTGNRVLSTKSSVWPSFLLLSSVHWLCLLPPSFSLVFLLYPQTSSSVFSLHRWVIPRQNNGLLCFIELPLSLSHFLYSFPPSICCGLFYLLLTLFLFIVFPLLGGLVAEMEKM